MATKKKADKQPVKKSAPAKKKAAAKKSAPVKKNAPGNKKKKPGATVQAWELGESIPCAPDESGN